MLTEIRIQNFRGFQDLSIAPLKRVNLIIGQNNTGKTAVLEALALMLADPLQDVGRLPELFRHSGRNGDDDFWQWVFYNKDTTHEVIISGNMGTLGFFAVCLTSGKPSGAFLPIFNLSGRLVVMSTGGRMTAGLKTVAFSTRPTDPKQDAIDYNRVVVRRRKKQVETLLKKIEPRLESIETLQTGIQPLLYSDIGLSEMIPVTQMGQGFNRLLDIYSEIVAAEAKVLLIDEIENGIHHSVLETIWRGLFQAAREAGVQIFATTHSWECVLAADRAAREQMPYDLNLIRLDRVEDNIKATLIDAQAIGTAKELHWEMR
jgi:AAA15 family ATPase/GTPase